MAFIQNQTQLHCQCLSCGYYENVFKVEFHNSLFAKILIFSEITILSQNINSFI